MQALVDNGTLIPSLYQGSKIGEMRNGLGIQLFLNQSFYTGEWKDDRSNGSGVLAFNKGIVMKGHFRNNLFTEGQIAYQTGAFYGGSLDGSKNENFSRGTLHFANGLLLEGKWEDGVFVSGELSGLPDSLLKIKISFDDRKFESNVVFSFGKTRFKLYGEKGMVIDNAKKYVFEGMVEKGGVERVGYFYYGSHKVKVIGEIDPSTRKQHFQTFDINNGFCKSMVRILNQRSEGKEIYLFNGLRIKVSSQNLIESIDLPALGSDFYQLSSDFKVENFKRWRSPLKFGQGKYVYLGSHGQVEKIRKESFFNVFDHQDISDARIKFLNVFGIMMKENSALFKYIEFYVFEYHSADISFLDNLLKVFVSYTISNSNSNMKSVERGNHSKSRDRHDLGQECRKSDIEKPKTDELANTRWEKEIEVFKSEDSAPNNLSLQSVDGSKENRKLLKNSKIHSLNEEYIRANSFQRKRPEIIQIDSDDSPPVDVKLRAVIDFNRGEEIASKLSLIQISDSNNSINDPFEEENLVKINNYFNYLTESLGLGDSAKVVTSNVVSGDVYGLTGELRGPLGYSNYQCNDRSAQMNKIPFSNEHAMSESFIREESEVPFGQINGENGNTLNDVMADNFNFDRASINPGQKSMAKDKEDLILQDQKEDLFFGTSVLGRKKGLCMVFHQDGLKYHGVFKCNKRSGIGKLVTPSGDILAGRFIDDEPIGPFYKISANGKVVKGGLVNGKFVTNEERLINNFVVKGELIDGDLFVGKGVILSDCFQLTCEFIDAVLIKDSGCILRDISKGVEYEGRLALDKRSEKGFFISNEKDTFKVNLPKKKIRDMDLRI
jgi:hypothetical protein